MNSTRLLLSLLLAVLFCSCASTAPPQQDRRELLKPYLRERHLVHMTPGQTFAQGMLGVSYLSESNFDDSATNPAVIQDSDIQQVPMIGGAFQHALWGDRVDAGLEVGGTFGFQSGGAFVATGGGGLVVAVDVDMFLFDLFAGPFVSVPLGNKTRIYGGAGPVMQFAEWDQRGDGIDQSGSGFGTGLYARTGLEFEVTPAILIGIGARWSDTQVSLGSGLGNLDLAGTQAMVTFTAGT
jgi:opacity protein-like surface antigen